MSCAAPLYAPAAFIGSAMIVALSTKKLQMLQDNFSMPTQTHRKNVCAS